MAESLAQWQQPGAIQSALALKRIAVVGLSPNELRPSHDVASYMLQHGYQIIPVNPRESEIFDLTCYPSLRDVPHPIDVVNVFRDPSAVPAIAEDAVAIKAKYLWLQLGVISPAGVEIGEAGNLQCIVDRCLKIEHARYLGHKQ